MGTSDCCIYHCYLLHVQVMLKSCARSKVKRKPLVSMTASVINQEGFGAELWRLKRRLVSWKKSKGIYTRLMEVSAYVLCIASIK